MDLSESKIYVGTYAKYNDGSIFGKWLTLSDYADKDEFYEACKELHKDEEDPELMFQDWEDIPDAMVGECFISEKWWELYDEVGDDEDEADKVIAYFENCCSGNFLEQDMTLLVRDAQDEFVCKEEDWDDYVEDRISEYLAQFDGFNRSYFDDEYYKSELEDDYTMADGYVFKNY